MIATKMMFPLPLLLLQLVMTLPAQTPPSKSDASVGREVNLSQRQPRYHLRKSDVLGVSFALSPEFDQVVSVQPDGFITLKAAGSIPAEDLTVPELTNAIQIAYSKILHEPIVTIDLKEYDKPYFIASGELGKPGKYELRSDLTVTEAIAVAGGFTQSARHSQVVLFRPSGQGMTEARVIDVKKMLKSRQLTEDIHLRPGDMIFVPQSRISKIAKYLPTSSLGLYGSPAAFF